jgi:fatty-acid desaturase
MDQRSNWIKVAGLSWLVYFAVGASAAAVSGASGAAAVRLGLSLLIWGAVLRTVIVWHMTWTINSVTHLWGYRSYDTPDDSRNNPIIGFLVSGEGWHNNHHADPAAARYGRKWWELDVAWLVIRCLLICGLARNVVARLPPPNSRAHSLASRRKLLP